MVIHATSTLSPILPLFIHYILYKRTLYMSAKLYNSGNIILCYVCIKWECVCWCKCPIILMMKAYARTLCLPTWLIIVIAYPTYETKYPTIIIQLINTPYLKNWSITLPNIKFLIKLLLLSYTQFDEHSACVSIYLCVYFHSNDKIYSYVSIATNLSTYLFP